MGVNEEQSPRDNHLGAFYLHAYRPQSSYSLILLFSADVLGWMEGPSHAKGQR